VQTRARRAADGKLMVLRLDVREQSILTATGELDIATAPAFREALLTLIAAGHARVVVDLDSVTFMDSTGLGVLASANKRMRSEGRELLVVCHRPEILRLFSITGLHSFFTVRNGDDRPIPPPPEHGRRHREHPGLNGGTVSS